MNIERQLLIPNPPPNDNWDTRFFIDDGNEFIGLLKYNLNEKSITPNSHPRVLELFAGDAPISYLLSQWGWTDFTCVDWKQSKYAQASPPKYWIYINLLEMLYRLIGDGDLSQVQHLKGQFDIVTATFAIDKPNKLNFSFHNCEKLCSYFCREKGFIYTL